MNLNEMVNDCIDYLIADCSLFTLILKQSIKCSLFFTFFKNIL